MNKLIATMNSTPNAMVIRDTNVILKYLDSTFNNGNIGIVGYCMSGRLVMSAAANFNHKIKATASFYGVDIVTENKDSPHLHASMIKGEVYLAFAEKDYWVPKKSLDILISIFSKLKLKSEIEIYKGTDHGFAFPDRVTYNQKAADKHWKKLFSLFDRNLKK